MHLDINLEQGSRVALMVMLNNLEAQGVETLVIKDKQGASIEVNVLERGMTKTAKRANAYIILQQVIKPFETTFTEKNPVVEIEDITAIANNIDDDFITGMAEFALLNGLLRIETDKLFLYGIKEPFKSKYGVCIAEENEKNNQTSVASEFSAKTLDELKDFVVDLRLYLNGITEESENFDILYAYEKEKFYREFEKIKNNSMKLLVNNDSSLEEGLSSILETVRPAINLLELLADKDKTIEKIKTDKKFQKNILEVVETLPKPLKDHLSLVKENPDKCKNCKQDQQCPLQEIAKLTEIKEEEIA